MAGDPAARAPVSVSRVGRIRDTVWYMGAPFHPCGAMRPRSALRQTDSMLGELRVASLRLVVALLVSACSSVVASGDAMDASALLREAFLGQS